MHLGSKDVVKLPYGRVLIIWIAFNFLPNYRSNRDSDRKEKDVLLRLAVCCARNGHVWLLEAYG